MEKYLSAYKTKLVEALANTTGRGSFNWFVDDQKLMAGLKYGVFVNSNIHRGQIKSVDCSQAMALPGVLIILSHFNRGSNAKWEKFPGNNDKFNDFKGGCALFNDDQIHYYQQPVALVIAEDFATAIAAARLVKVSYRTEQYQLCFDKYKAALIRCGIENLQHAGNNTDKCADVKIESEYKVILPPGMPVENHAAIVLHESQSDAGVNNKLLTLKIVRKNISHSLRIKEDNVKAHTSSGNPMPELPGQLSLAEMGAMLGAEKTRQSMVVVADCCRQPGTANPVITFLQKITLKCSMDGIISGITQEILANVASHNKLIIENRSLVRSLYGAEKIEILSRLTTFNGAGPLAVNGLKDPHDFFALECAIDELAYLLNIDPVALRIKNFMEQYPVITFKECYELGAKNFEWYRRKSRPGITQSGGWLSGMGTSVEIVNDEQITGCATAVFDHTGNLWLECIAPDESGSSIDMLTRIAADAFSIEKAKVHFKPTNFPLHQSHYSIDLPTMNEAAEVIYGLANQLRQEIIDIAICGKELIGIDKNESRYFLDKSVLINNTSGEAIQVTDLLRKYDLPNITVVLKSKHDLLSQAHLSKSFFAHFAEVLIHPVTGKIKVSRILTAVSTTKETNLKALASEVYNSILSTLENILPETIGNKKAGLYENHSALNHYLPLNTDIPPIEVIFVNKTATSWPDTENPGKENVVKLNSLIAAISNAVYHAGGKRLRTLPLRLEN